MPLVKSTYQAPFLLKNGHLATIYASAFRKVQGVTQHRKRLNLKDGDFLDLDWSFAPTSTNKVVVLLHGLEGNAQRPYMLGAAKEFNTANFDVCAVNYRGCSGSPNRHYASYHSGAVNDVHALITHIIQQNKYQNIYAMGFSLGGNLILKYVATAAPLPRQLKRVVAISVPCDLEDTCNQLLLPKNRLYAQRFKKSLIGKLRKKQQQFSNTISQKSIKGIKTLRDFDEVYTAPAHGFANAAAYYRQCSCLPQLTQLKLPSLIINAKNDSFLGANCYPYKTAKQTNNFYLETPKHGGHVSFLLPGNITYAEKRAVQFFNMPL